MTMAAVILILLFASLVFVAFIFVIGGKSKEDVEVLEKVRNPLIMQILVPRENDKTPLAAEQMFASIHGILGDSIKSLDLISFEIISSGNSGIKFYAVVPKHLGKFVEGQIYAQYPNADIRYVDDYTSIKEDNMQQRQLYIDLDGVLVDFEHGLPPFVGQKIQEFYRKKDEIGDKKPKLYRPKLFSFLKLLF